MRSNKDAILRQRFQDDRLEVTLKNKKSTDHNGRVTLRALATHPISSTTLQGLGEGSA